MQKHRNTCRRANRPGYALIFGLLLIPIVICMIFHFKKMYGSVYQIGKGRSDIKTPWRQWHRLPSRLHRGPIGQPSPQQPQISKAIEVAAEPNEDSQQRGQLVLFVLPDGTVQGQWSGQFFISKDVDFQIMGCKFKGLTDPQQVFSDEQGQDRSKLFFISKGPFIILETNDESGKVRSVMGESYVRGWLGLDNMVEGEIILTTDKKNFYLYSWQGEANEAAHFLTEGNL